MKKILTYMILFAALCSSCSDWLDIQPSDRISEENNFSTLSGFKKALNGIYVELNQNDLYGQNLTCGFVEILAQRYAVGEENKSAKEYMQFSYAGSAAESILTSVWSRAYTLIANANAILKNCEGHREVLTDDYYRLIKGEALALRGMLHFDVFRLWGPPYGSETVEVALPYYKEFSLNVAPSYSATDFMSFVVADLLEAEQLLDKDPVIAYGVKGDSRDSFLQYRNLRLNYYAVQALLARVYYYMGDDEQAFAYAKKITEVQAGRFPWITPMKLSNSAAPDRVFSTELLFALQNLERNAIFTSYFDGSNLKLTTLLAPREDVVNYIFNNDKVDYRYTSSLGSTVEISGTQYCVFNKYQSLNADSIADQMIPMIRVSEAYLIAAETAVEQADKMKYFNEFLNHRGLKSQSYFSDYYYEQEWKKEFYGEGQLFFWYKRNRMTEMQSATDPYGTVSVRETDYVMPIPEGESKYN